MHSSSPFLIALLAAALVGGCIDNISPSPENTPDLGPDLGPDQDSPLSMPIPSYGGDGSWEPIDGSPVQVLQVSRVQAERTLVMNVDRHQGIKVVDLQNPANPTVVATLPLEGYPTAIYESGDWVLLVVHRYENQVSSTDVLVIDGSDLSSPTIAGRVSVDDYTIDSALVSEKLFLILSGSDGTGVVGVTWNSEGQPTAGGRIDLGPLTTARVSNDQHLVVVKREVSPSSSTSENNVTPAEAAEIHVFDAHNSHGSVVVPGPVKEVDIREDVLRVGFETSQTGSFAIEQVLRTFDIADLSAIALIDSKKIAAELPLVFVPNGAVYRNTSVPIGAAGQIGTPSGTGVNWWRNNWRFLEGGQVLMVESENPPHGPSELKVSLLAIDPGSALISELATSQVNALGENLQIGVYQVIEDAVSVLADDGLTEETGLIVVPYAVDAGWNQKHGALQIFTFSETSVSARGMIDAYATVPLKAIGLGPNLAISNGTEFSIYDISNPAMPQALSRLELFPTITEVFGFGLYVLRRHVDFNYNTGTLAIGRQNNRVEVVLAEDLHGEALASFEVPAIAVLHQSGDTLVATTYERGSARDDVTTHIDVWDLSNPLMPTQAPRLTEQDFPRYYGEMEARTSNYLYGPRLSTYAIDDGLIYMERIVTQISRSGDIPFQSWATIKLHLLDLSEPSQPFLGPVVELPADARVVDIYATQTKLFITTWEHISVEGDAYSYVEHKLHTVDYSDLSAPSQSLPVQVAGRVVHVEDDVLIAFDGVPNVNEGVDARITRQRLGASGANTEASHTVLGRDAHDVRVVGSSVLVSHSERWEDSFSLDIITIPAFEVVSLMNLGASWINGSTDQHVAYSGRQSVVVDVEDPLNPVVFTSSVSTWQRRMMRLGDALLVAAGREGVVVVEKP